MDGFAGFIKKSDATLLYLFNRRLRCMALNILMRIITQFGSTGFSILLPVTLLFLGKGNAKELGYQMGITLTLSQFFVHSIKRLVNRPRPYRTLEEIIALKPPGCKYSFPSGHTCSAVSMALVLGVAFPEIQVIVLLLAFLVGISRMYLGFHYPTDVVVGALLAYISFYLTIFLNIIEMFIKSNV